MASVTTVLNRLVAYGEARAVVPGKWPPRLADGLPTRESETDVRNVAESTEQLGSSARKR